MNQLQMFQFYDKYSRFSQSLGRRETWEESVDRAVRFLVELSENKLAPEIYEKIRVFMLNQWAFPSMRLFAMAGDPARRDSTVLYNCSYLPIDSLLSFSEALAISMAGCGVGYSVERRYVDLLPVVSGEIFEDEPWYPFVIDDSTEGWVAAIGVAIREAYAGFRPQFDYSKIRPAGSLLFTKGGTASGPAPLKRLIEFAVTTIHSAAGRKLRPIEVHDIMTMIGDCAVSGGARRSAMISLFDLDDDEMLHAKDYGWWKFAPQRANANNSVVIEGRLSRQEWADLFERIDEGGGEPGFFIRSNVNSLLPSRRDYGSDWGMNPCGEINLRPRQFCNLSQAIARSGDTVDILMEKVEVATIIGTIQSMAVNFANLEHPDWVTNAINERLLGVDVTGQMDCPILDERVLELLRHYAVAVNKKYARDLGINQAAAVTCVKPSGNSSVLFDCSPGLHSRWSKYYIRRVRVNASSVMRYVMEGSGMDLLPENGQKYDTASTMVAEFAVAAPAGAVTNGDRGAIEQCEWWKINKIYFTEHNPSVTILFKPHELNDVIDWVYENQTIIGGMSFLPKDDHYYPLAPYEAISKEAYEQFPITKLDFSLLPLLERHDTTSVAREVACVAGLCEI